MALLTTIETIDSFLQENQSRYSENTLDLYRLSIIQFFSFCRKEYNQIVRQDINAWKADLYLKGNKPNSIRTKLVAQRSYFKYLAEENLIIKNPNRAFKLPDKGETLPRSLSKEKTAILLEYAKDYSLERMVIEMLLATGVRISELLSIQKSDIKWDSLQIWIRKGKGCAERYVLFTTECSVKLKKYLSEFDVKGSRFLFPNKRGNQRCKAWAEKFFRKYSKELGFRVTPHSLRYTFAVRLAEKGMPLPYLQILLGHKDIKTTKIYAEIDGTARKVEYDRYQ